MAGTRLNGHTPRGDVTVYSFQAVKTLPTADSGMICFNEADHDAIARQKSWLGINKDTYSRMASNATYRWMYDVSHVGFKYHGNSIMAAIGLVQLRRLEADLDHRRRLVEVYDSAIGRDNRIGRILTAPGCRSAHHLYQVELDNRDEMILKLNANNIFPGVHYRDNREYHMYRQTNDTCPNATRVTRRLLSLPLHMRLDEADVRRVSDCVLANAA
jgi:dTDP-4-amino-4,6-dideoxygalactose transaminase